MSFVYDMDEVSHLEEEPPGVVIEVVEDDEDAMRTLIPEIRKGIEQIRQRFPELHIAIVSHGNEMLALTKSEALLYQDIQDGIRLLVENYNITVHICGRYASWNEIAPEDFPDYIDIAPSGPAQINNYLSLEYIHIQM